jgi:hypothetical protein
MMSRKDWLRRDIAGRQTFWTEKKSGQSSIGDAAWAATRRERLSSPLIFSITFERFHRDAMQRSNQPIARL